MLRTTARAADAAMPLLLGTVLLVMLAAPWLGSSAPPVLEAWATVLTAVVVQSLPFLALGVGLSACVAVLVPANLLRAGLPRRGALAVPVAGLAGLALPGCECASVPLAHSLVRQGVPTAAAVTFLLAAPAINPVVLVATAVAFPGRPEMVLARFLAGLLTAVVVGWLWLWRGRQEWVEGLHREDHGGSRLQRLRESVQHDLLHAGGFIVLGAVAAATVNVLLPQEWLAWLGAHPLLAVLGLAALAVVMALCSEADAFVAASFVAFSPTALLAFLVVGPAVDVKLAAMQAGIFGRDFATRVAPTTFVVALASACLAGWWLL